MIKRLVLKCFRKHENRTFDFTQGLTTIRGANEAGKSSLTEAILYALYGSAYLRTSLEDAVTWGQSASALKVELTVESNSEFGMRNSEFVFTRGQSGAEVKSNGTILATGQREVSAFAAKLLGADGRAAQRLLFANQNGLRGALEEGPKAIAGQVEALAGFDLFDTVIERMRGKLILGPSAAQEARLERARERLAAWVAPEKPDPERLKQEIAAASGTLDEALQALNAARARFQEARSVLDRAEESGKLRQSLEESITRAESTLRNQHLLIEQADREAASRPSEDALAQVKADIEGAEGYAALCARYQEYHRLPRPKARWEGSEARLREEMQKLKADIEKDEAMLQTFREQERNTREELKLAQAMLIKDLICPACGQEIKNLDEVRAQNKQLERRIRWLDEEAESLRVKAQDYQKFLTKDRGMLQDLNEILAAAGPIEAYLERCPELVRADRTFIPPELTWAVAVPTGEADDPRTLKKTLLDLERQCAAADRAEGQREAYRQAIPGYEREVLRLQTQLATLPEADTARLKAILTRAMEEAQQVEEQAHAAERTLFAAKAAAEKLEEDYRTETERGRELKEEVKRCEEELAALAFNNALLKKIRALRPLVADRLWNTLLSTVGALFSRIREEDSVIVKDAGGFRCNGQVVESLSGSTLDALGAAIRVALCKTFLPHADFIVLDEPAAACDPQRTANLLAFLASAGFGQILLVTHEEMSETYADTLIALEEEK